MLGAVYSFIFLVAAAFLHLEMRDEATLWMQLLLIAPAYSYTGLRIADFMREKNSQ